MTVSLPPLKFTLVVEKTHNPTMDGVGFLYNSAEELALFINEFDGLYETFVIYFSYPSIVHY